MLQLFTNRSFCLLRAPLALGGAALLGVILVASFPTKIFAASPQIDTLITQDILSNVSDAVSLLIPLVFTLILLAFLWGLVKFVWGASSDEKAQGKAFMFWGVVALFVAASVWGIVALLADLFGVNKSTKAQPNPTATLEAGVQ